MGGVDKDDVTGRLGAIIAHGLFPLKETAANQGDVLREIIHDNLVGFNTS